MKYDFFATDGKTCMDCVTDEHERSEFVWETMWSKFEQARDEGEI